MNENETQELLIFSVTRNLKGVGFFEIAMIFWPRKEFITVHKKNYDSQ